MAACAPANDSTATYQTVFGVGSPTALNGFTINKLAAGTCTSVALIQSDAFPSAVTTPMGWSVESIYQRADATGCDTLPNAETDWPAPEPSRVNSQAS